MRDGTSAAGEREAAGVALEADGDAARRTDRARIRAVRGHRQERLAFTASIPKWDKAKGTNNYCGYAGFSARLAGSGAFTYAYTNAVGSVDAHCYGDVSPRIDVYAKSKRTGDTTRLSFIADRPTANYTLHQPQTYKGAGFYFIAFPEMFNTTLEMAKGEKRDFHYVLEVTKELKQ